MAFADQIGLTHQKMKLLAIETSSSVGSASVLDSAGDSFEIDFPEGTKHGRALVPSIETLLKGTCWDSADLDVVAVSIGPGTYTGLRIGLVCAKMISALTGASLVTVSSLDVIARNADNGCEHVCVVVDARRNEVYTGSYERHGASWSRRSDCAIVRPGELAASLEPGSCLVGDGIPVVRDAVRQKSVSLAPHERWMPRAEVVAEIGAELYLQGVRHDPRTTEPMYLRRPAAEEKWDQREAACE